MAEAGDLKSLQSGFESQWGYGRAVGVEVRADARPCRTVMSMSSYVERRSNPTAWAAFWVALAGLVLMPIPLFIGLILGGGLSVIAAILAVIALLKGLARSGKGIAPVVFATIFIALTWGGISVGGGVIW